MTQPEFNIGQRLDGGHVIVTLSGELDLAVGDRVSATLREHLEAGRRLVVDLSEVTFIDSTGLGAILRSVRSEQDSARLTLRRSRHPQPNRLFTLTGVAGMLHVEPEFGELIDGATAD